MTLSSLTVIYQNSGSLEYFLKQLSTGCERRGAALQQGAGVVVACVRRGAGGCYRGSLRVRVRDAQRLHLGSERTGVRSSQVHLHGIKAFEAIMSVLAWFLLFTVQGTAVCQQCSARSFSFAAYVEFIAAVVSCCVWLVLKAVTVPV